MVKFIIVRHGFSEGNKEKRFSGQLDVPLAEEGAIQAERIAEYIAEKYEVDAIYSSDLSRAYNTVKPLADRLGITVRKEKSFREINVGVWQGMLIEDVRNKFSEDFEIYKTNPCSFGFPKGETYKDVVKRCSMALEKIARENEGKTIVLGTHGGIVRAICAIWDNVSLEELKDIPIVPNASVSVANYDDGKVSWLEKGYNGFLDEKISELGLSIYK